jgi:hypothetical protein
MYEADKQIHSQGSEVALLLINAIAEWEEMRAILEIVFALQCPSRGKISNITGIILRLQSLNTFLSITNSTLTW